METIVKKITFDLTYNGVEYRGLDSGYDDSGICYDKDYLIRGKDYEISNIKVDYITK